MNNLLNKITLKFAKKLPLSIKQVLTALLIGCCCSAGYAKTFGEAADTLFTGATIITKLAWAGCILVGMFLLVGTMVHYKEHKRNPKLAPMVTVIAYFTLAVASFSLPFLSKCFGKDGYDVVHPKYSTVKKYRPSTKPANPNYPPKPSSPVPPDQNYPPKRQ